MPTERTVFTLTVEEYHEHADAYDGICLKCGDWSCGGVEPDARGYRCDSCDEPAVMGAEDALVAGYLEIDGDDEGGNEGGDL